MCTHVLIDDHAEFMTASAVPVILENWMFIHSYICIHQINHHAYKQLHYC